MRYQWPTAELFALLFCVSIVNAANLPFHEVRRDTISGISNINFIDPILDRTTGHLGYVLTDSSNSSIHLLLFARVSLITVPVPHFPLMTINRASGDSLIIYALLWRSESSWDRLYLERLIIRDTIVYSRTQTVPASWGSGMNVSTDLRERNLKFAVKGHFQDDPEGVIVEIMLRGWYLIPGDQGVASELIPTSVLYDLSLDTVKIRRPFSTIVEGGFTSPDSTEFIGIMNLSYYSVPQDSLWLAPASVLRGVRIDSSSFMFQPTAGYTSQLAVDRINSDWKDDIITLGKHSGFLQNHPSQEHLAAYSIKPDTLTELWYLPLPTIYPQYWRLDGYWSASFSHLLWRGDTCLYRFTSDGYILDSTFIDSDFDCKKLYEFGADLYLALRTADTLQLLRWDVATSIGDSSSLGLPSFFTLSQNHPNPFNATTEIRFSLERAADVTLTIYNLLGQNVKTLIDGRTSAGEHRVTWDGTDASGKPCATGVYLYQLVANDKTKSLKMLLLK